MRSYVIKKLLFLLSDLFQDLLSCNLLRLNVAAIVGCMTYKCAQSKTQVRLAYQLRNVYYQYRTND